MAGELDESLEGGENALFLGGEEVGDEAEDDSVLYHRAHHYSY